VAGTIALIKAVIAAYRTKTKIAAYVLSTGIKI
jgi:hypothetical protein